MTVDLKGTANTVLTVMAAHLTALPGFTPLPARQYVTVGQIAYDAEQFVVSVQNAVPGLPGPTAGMTPADAQHGAIVVWSLNVQVSLERKWPIPSVRGVPSVTDLTTAGATALDDGHFLVQAALNATQDRTLANVCGGIAIGSIDYTGPSGGIIGTTLNLQLQL